MRAPPLLRVLRPALAPTAACDVLAAATFAGGADAGRLALAAAGSVCLYMGGMGQNDLWDRGRDRDDRPLVANPSVVGRARLLVLALFAAGLVLGWLAGVIWAVAAVAVLASAYNMGLKRGFPADALTMGAARGANLFVGFAVVGGSFALSHWIYGAGYVLFIAGITGASRCEDLEPEPTRRLGLLLSLLPVLLACSVLGIWLGVGFVMAVPTALLLLSTVAAMRDGTRAGAQRHVFRSLIAIYLLHLCVMFAADDSIGYIAVLACAAATCFLLALFPRPTPDPT